VEYAFGEAFFWEELLYGAGTLSMGEDNKLMGSGKVLVYCMKNVLFLICVYEQICKIWHLAYLSFFFSSLSYK
jgi:hypothetical protein